MKKTYTISEVIEYYAEKNIFIEILADMYKTEFGLTWAGYVRWKDNNSNKWLEEDMGCLPDWEIMFCSTVQWIDSYLRNPVNGGTEDPEDSAPKVYLKDNINILRFFDWWISLDLDEIIKISKKYSKDNSSMNIKQMKHVWNSQNPNLQI